MCAENLSIVMCPNLMPVERFVGNSKSKEMSPDEEKAKLRSHLKVIEVSYRLPIVLLGSQSHSIFFPVNVSNILYLASDPVWKLCWLRK